MFYGRAEEAMNFYISIFKQSKVVNIIRYCANEAGAEGTRTSGIKYRVSTIVLLHFRK